jgi:8-oxo-dGTP diphosphatase
MKRPQGASIIFLNPANEVLLCLRDDIPTIPFPGKWDVPGGAIEEGETAAECVVREMQEEIEFDLKDPAVFKVYHLPDRLEHLFWQRSTLRIAETTLHEGQQLRWFSEAEIRARPEADFAFGFRQFLLQFFQERPFQRESRGPG